MKKTFYEFFAGGGMAHAGLGEEWVCTFANDLDGMKAEVYSANWGGETLVVQDVATVKSSQIPGTADLAWASFPCQDLSLAGNGVGLDGQRSGTLWPFMNLMRNLRDEGRKPSVIALENVYGAITSRGGKDFEAMIEALFALDYRVGAMVIDAVHFVPQSRPRLFVIAVDAAAEIPKDCIGLGPSPAWHPESLIKAHNRLHQDMKNRWIWWTMPMPKRRLKTLDDIIEATPQGVRWHDPTETEKLLQMMTFVNRQKVLQAQNAGHLKVGTIYKRTRNGVQRAEVRFDGVAGCLRTPSGGSSRQTIMVVDGPVIRSRLVSPREVARLMGLDDMYALPKRYNDAYHLAGDGVVVPVVSHLTKNIFTPIIDAIHAAAAPKELKEAA